MTHVPQERETEQGAWKELPEGPVGDGCEAKEEQGMRLCLGNRKCKGAMDRVEDERRGWDGTCWRGSSTSRWKGRGSQTSRASPCSRRSGRTEATRDPITDEGLETGGT